MYESTETAGPAEPARTATTTEPATTAGPAGPAERPEEPGTPWGGWRFGLDFEDSVAALEHPPGLEKAAKAIEWYFEGLPHEDRQVVQSVLPTWHQLLTERGPDYSLSTNSASATRLDADTVKLDSFYDLFEPVVVSNASFEAAIAAYQDFVEHDDRYR